MTMAPWHLLLIEALDGALRSSLREGLRETPRPDPTDPTGTGWNRHRGGRGPGARALIGGYVRSGTEKVTTEGARSGLPWMQGG